MRSHAAYLVATLGLALAAAGSCATSTDGNTGGASAAGRGGNAGDDAAGTGGSAQTGGGAAVGPGGFGGAGGVATNCGDGKIEPPETCDGDELDGKTCGDFGLSPGALQCNSHCQIVVSGCGAPESCANSVDDDDDGAIDCLDSDCASDAGCSDSCASPTALVLPTVASYSTLGRPDTYAPSCAVSSGSELILEVTPSQSGTLGISVSQWKGDFSVSVTTACGDAGSEVGCASKTSNQNFPENLQVEVSAGTTYFVMVDALLSTENADFEMRMFMVGGAEASCIDLLDADLDGLMDCQDPDCQTTSVCTNGTRALGEACAHTGQCDSADDDPLCLPSDLGFSAGYCSEFCDLTASDCPGDGQCFDYGIGGAGVCLDGCTTSAECRSGYACQDLGLASKVCYIAPEADCQNFEDDDFDQLTDCADPDCQATPTCTPGTTGYGEACSANAQCAVSSGHDPLCLLSPPFFFSNGYCSEFCNVAEGDCGQGGLCYDWFYLDGSTGQCFKRCQTSNDCASGLVCVNYGFGKHCNL